MFPSAGSGQRNYQLPSLLSTYYPLLSSELRSLCLSVALAKIKILFQIYFLIPEQCIALSVILSFVEGLVEGLVEGNTVKLVYNAFVWYVQTPDKPDILFPLFCSLAKLQNCTLKLVYNAFVRLVQVAYKPDILFPLFCSLLNCRIAH